MQAKVRNKISYIGDGEPLFRKWVSWGKAGTVQMVADWAKNECGLKNPKTGRGPSAMGIWAKMWRWALRNPELSRPLYADYVLELDGDQLTDDEWYSLLHERARVLLTRAGYKKYMVKYPDVAKYSNR